MTDKDLKPVMAILVKAAEDEDPNLRNEKEALVEAVYEKFMAHELLTEYTTEPEVIHALAKEVIEDILKEREIA